jgi:hypothetical protein
MEAKNKIINILFILTGIGISIFVVKQFIGEKSFLKMNEAEKKKFIYDAEKKILDIRNDPKLTEQEKSKAIETINKEKEDNYTEEEKKAIAEVWVKELQTGNLKINFSSDLAIFKI